MINDKPILKSIIWAFVILIFPVVSGVITQVLMMSNNQKMFIQGCFMLISLIIPILYMCKFEISSKKINQEETVSSFFYGFRPKAINYKFNKSFEMILF